MGLTDPRNLTSDGQRLAGWSNRVESEGLGGVRGIGGWVVGTVLTSGQTVDWGRRLTSGTPENSTKGGVPNK